MAQSPYARSWLCHTSTVNILCVGQFEDSTSPRGNPWAFELFKIGCLNPPGGEGFKLCSHAQPKCQIRLSIFLEKTKDCELILIDQALLKAWQISAHVVKSTTPQISTHLLGHNVKQAPLLNKRPPPPPPPLSSLTFANNRNTGKTCFYYHFIYNFSSVNYRGISTG